MTVNWQRKEGVASPISRYNAGVGFMPQGRFTQNCLRWIWSRYSYIKPFVVRRQRTIPTSSILWCFRLIIDDLKEGTSKAVALGALRPLVISCPPLRYNLSGLWKSNQEVGFGIATELEAVKFIAGKIKPGLVPGPIALSIAESVAKKKTPNEGGRSGSYGGFGPGSADIDQQPNISMGPEKERSSLPNHLIPPSPLTTHSLRRSINFRRVAHQLAWAISGKGPRPTSVGKKPTGNCASVVIAIVHGPIRPTSWVSIWRDTGDY